MSGRNGVTIDDLRPGLKHSATITVDEALAVPASGRLVGGTAEMPPVFATANMIAFVEWTCVAALAPYLAPDQRTVGTRVEITHLAATPIGMRVTAAVELVEVDGRRLRFRVGCRDEIEPIGEGFHERTIVDHARFMQRLARKNPANPSREQSPSTRAGQRNPNDDIAHRCEQHRRGS